MMQKKNLNICLKTSIQNEILEEESECHLPHIILMTWPGKTLFIP